MSFHSKNNRLDNRCPLTASKPERAAANKLTSAIKASLPSGLALWALAGANCTNLAQLMKIKEADLLKLHGDQKR